MATAPDGGRPGLRKWKNPPALGGDSQDWARRRDWKNVSVCSLRALSFQHRCTNTCAALYAPATLKSQEDTTVPARLLWRESCAPFASANRPDHRRCHTRTTERSRIRDRRCPHAIAKEPSTMMAFMQFSSPSFYLIFHPSCSSYSLLILISLPSSSP